MKLRYMTAIGDVPDSFPALSTTDEQKEWVKSLAAEIVDFCWLSPSTHDLATIEQELDLGLQNGGEDHPVEPYCCNEGNVVSYLVNSLHEGMKKLFASKAISLQIENSTSCKFSDG